MTYLVWNPGGSECVGFPSYEDAYWTAHGKWPQGYESNFYPTLGQSFREIYAEDLEEGEALIIMHCVVPAPSLEETRGT